MTDEDRRRTLFQRLRNWFRSTHDDTPNGAPRQSWRMTLFLMIPMMGAIGIWMAITYVPEARRALHFVHNLIDEQAGTGRSLSLYEPSSQPAVDAMMDMIAPTAEDTVIDIGSGDGRIVIRAAVLGANAIGIERREALVKTANENAWMAGVTERAQFVHADAMTLPSIIEQATVVVLFLTPDGLAILGPWLENDVLKPGTRIVSSTWPVPGWRPEEVVITGENQRTWAIYLYRHPARDPHAEEVIPAGKY